ncbi:hypothetical protein [Bradyrhizobium sp. ORS 86]|uniref:hypothetical protein n=1 Tax=Bradyrhizobium sp. ORS 86 TaxID=1685970 RepID=UPI00388EBD76
MLALWIIGLAFVGSGLAALLFGVSALETPFGSALFGSGLIFVASGVMIAALGFVVRHLDRLRMAIETRAELPLAEPTEPVPAIATATMERPSPLRPKDAKRPAEQDVPEPDDTATLQETTPRRVGRWSRPDRPASPARRTPAREARQASTVVHSGTVNNMNYQLRADGTIVAMLPGRTLEFASIDELRARLAALPEDDEDASAGQRSA